MPKTTVIADISTQSTILARVTNFDCVTVIISSADVTADTKGKKLLKAGTFLGSATAGKKVLVDNAAAKPDNSVTSEGLLFYDVDVTNGDLEAAMLYKGTVALTRLPEAPAAGVNLPRVTFVKD